MITVASLIIITASISATVFICLIKWRIIEYYELHRRKGWGDTVCDFCFCFWFSVVITILIMIFYISDIFYIAVPFGAASIGKMIINFARGQNK